MHQQKVLVTACRFGRLRQRVAVAFMPRQYFKVSKPCWNANSRHFSLSSRVAGNSSVDATPDSPYTLIHVTQQDGLRTITMNDKKTRNSLSLHMMNELISAITKDKSSKELRCIVITATNESPVFSSGHNLKELTSDQGVAAQKNVVSTCTELILSIRNAEVPVIAVINGLAAAAGCQLVASCDFSVATEKSSFSTPGASFGLFCSTPGVSVSRAVNRSTAAFLVLTGQSLSAKDALNANLVTKVVPEEKLESCVQEIYKSISSKSRSVVQLGRQFFYEQLEMPYEKALREGENVMVRNMQLKDCQEGLQSFKAKRHPAWSHNDDKVS
ncbi:Enoyl-CoA hydratase domain-containing protein 3, mitochondrial [Orchesella cincta]|uniref:Enoyl-CoA hydratase domain-containing protein 3, mitochondrial n=1 Tax=Orchesella cincta TaxID=48709 RepID=A0A1D2N062_ORCCI|nr:Enoyl-CoA hydratase domain-containing protein 3, mitochondrial [Orchesella cincta]